MKYSQIPAVLHTPSVLAFVADITGVPQDQLGYAQESTMFNLVIEIDITKWALPNIRQSLTDSEELLIVRSVDTAYAEVSKYRTEFGHIIATYNTGTDRFTITVNDEVNAASRNEVHFDDSLSPTPGDITELDDEIDD